MATALRAPAKPRPRRRRLHVQGGRAAMSRRRSSASTKLSCRQDQALGCTMRVVRELGPTAFVLQEQEEGEEEERLPAAEHRVSLGNPHSCNCLTFVKEKDLCKHICWLLLKKFKLPRNHEYALQVGLVEREINYVLQHPQIISQPPKNVDSIKEVQTDSYGYIKKKEIDNEDVCPICQEPLLKKMLPVTYCRYGCGNNVHIVCMKIWSDHQKLLEKDSLVKCPLCRENFASLKVILEEFINCKRHVTIAEKTRLDKHLGIPCNNCRICPIEGNCYKCTVCNEYHLCDRCFSSFCHPSHTFAVREKRNQIWRPVEPTLKLAALEENLRSVNSNEMSKEEKGKEKLSCTPVQIINSLPTVMVRKCSSLLGPGLQCRLCLKGFCLGQVTRFLPCHHKFHRKCIDNWLFKDNACPIDGHIVYNPLAWDNLQTKDKVNLSASEGEIKQAKQSDQDLFIPGTRLLSRPMKPGPVLKKTQARPEECCKETKSQTDLKPNLTLNGFSYNSKRDSGFNLNSIQKARNLKFSRYFKGLALIPKPAAIQNPVASGLRGLSINGTSH
ncbi:E3 ubiquitin-protein ligase ZSWIM2 isoform X2 [Anolis carolinensis]|uniref:E3 ubiquitin-protein ligase ZSWIM2 isoform X2 n=1 Tax=Anolis carolinensis TaxID=28377 RepID=UPI002F2B42AA